MFRCFLISCKKAKVQKVSVVCHMQRKGEPEVTQLHLQCAKKFICVAFSGKHISAVCHKGGNPLLHYQSDLLLEVALIGLGKKLKGRAEEKKITDKRQKLHKCVVKCWS